MDERNLRRRSRRFKSRCIDCKYAIFDEIWGDYKCSVKKHRVHNPEEYTDCKDYKKGTGTTSKRSDDE